jgi:hypothetical protein
MLSASLLAGFLVLGCTHSAVQPVPPNNDVVYLKAGDREPAQAYQLLWHPATFQMEVARASESKTAQGVVTQEMVWKDIVTDYRDTYVDREVTIAGTCAKAVCPQATGQSELWNAYFSAPKEKKADALSKAIDGIGDVSAKALVEKGYFRSKPRSWDDFTAEMDRAANAGVIKKNVATMATDTYQDVNIAKLGYQKEACTYQKYSCSKTILQPTLVRVPVQREVEKRRMVQSKPVEVRVNVTGAKLLSFEKDSLFIAVDENGRASVDDGNGFNRYMLTRQSVYGNQVNLDITADARVLRDLPGNVVLRDSYELIGGKATFALELDPKYFVDAGVDPNGQFVVDYEVNTCEYGWAGCWGSWKKMSRTTAVMTSPKLSITMDIPKKNKSYISYKISKVNSEFFNAKSISDRSSDSVKMPK